MFVQKFGEITKIVISYSYLTQYSNSCHWCQEWQMAISGFSSVNLNFSFHNWPISLCSNLAPHRNQVPPCEPSWLLVNSLVKNSLCNCDHPKRRSSNLVPQQEDQLTSGYNQIQLGEVTITILCFNLVSQQQHYQQQGESVL